MAFTAHFTALLEVFETAVGGPADGGLEFPETGCIDVSLDVDGVEGQHQATFRYAPDASIPNGTVGEVECRLRATAAVGDPLSPGARFEVVAERRIARGTVLDVFGDNWT